jgi:hypothetical protein
MQLTEGWSSTSAEACNLRQATRANGPFSTDNRRGCLLRESE